MLSLIDILSFGSIILLILFVLPILFVMVKLTVPLISEHASEVSKIRLAFYFVIGILGIFGSLELNKFGELLARNELKNILNDPNIELSLKNERMSTDNSAILISELLRLDHFESNHSHPSKNFNVSLESGSFSYSIKLAEDSKDSTIYWVYWDKYLYTTNNVFGKIKSDNDFLKKIIHNKID